MKISEMLEREDLYPTIEETLNQYFGFKEHQILKIQGKGKGEIFGYIYERLNAIVSKVPDKKVKKFLYIEYRSKNFIKRILAQIYLCILLNSYGLFARKILLNGEGTQLDSHILIYPCNKKIRIFNFKENFVDVVVKNGFSFDLIEKEIEFREQHLSPHILPIISKTNNSYREKIIDGSPLARITNDKKYQELRKQTLKILKSEISNYVKNVEPRWYVEKLLGEFNQKIDGAGLEQLKSSFDKLSEIVIGSFDEIPVVLSHGDLQHGNVWVENITDRIIIIDFETYSERSRFYDPFTLFHDLRSINFHATILYFLKTGRSEVLGNKNIPGIIALILLEDILFQLNDLAFFNLEKQRKVILNYDFKLSKVIKEMLKSIQDNRYYILMADLLAENKDEQKNKRIERILDISDLDHFFNVCKRHEVVSIVYKSLLTFYKKPLPACWEKECLRVKEQISFMLEITRSLCEELAKIELPMVVLKNGGIALQLMDDPSLCPMGDIDTLVRKEDFRKAHEVILRKGFKFRFRSKYEANDIEKAFFDGGTEYLFEGKNGQRMWIELSHRAIAGRWIRHDKEPKTDELINRSQLISNSFVRVLSPEDNLLQVSIHTAKHSYVREPGFRLHLDVDRIVSRQKIDWYLFLHNVNIAGSKTAVYFSLFLSKMLFDTTIPDWVLDELRPKKRNEKRILDMIKKAGIFEPAENKFSKFTFIRFQLSLYDSPKDAWHVIFPSGKWLKGKYNFRNSLLIPFYLCLRILDLVGIRKGIGE